MPGTIQVSVLEFKSSSSSSASSSISVKVSIGKRNYQTWDKGEFYFPLTTLRDNLVVALQDADGNEIAHTGVRTMSIVEKGSWDDIFPFEGGGHVHMKLQFILSEEDRNRIRTMRESAMRKKKNTKSASLTESSSILVDQNVPGKEVINLLGQTEAKSHPESELKKGSSPHGDLKKKKDQNIFRNLQKSRSENSPDDAPGGLVGQVIKIAIIVGFGVFVLLTRQREPRKSSKTEAKDHVFSTHDYKDEQISIKDTVDQIKYLQ